MGMAERGQLPAVCAAKSQHGTPTAPILVSLAATSLVAAFGFATIVEVAESLPISFFFFVFFIHV
jgi:amino acid permease